jgi:S1-C subfamily serine protease
VRREPSGPARIAELRPGSSAAQSLREGDLVLEIAGKPPGDPEALRDLDKVPVVVERDGKRLEVEVAQVVIVQ